MTPGGLGIDLIEIARIERALERHPRLAARIYTERELAYAATSKKPGRHLAARFAAKEAVVKALALGPGTAIRQIEVLAGDPAPSIELHDDVARIAAERGLIVKVSLTHAREMAGAVAISEAV